MNRAFTTSLVCLALVGCAQPNAETAVVTMQSVDAPNETVTVRLQHRPGEMGSYAFVTGQVVGASLVNLRVNRTSASPSVEFLVKKEGTEIPVSIPLGDGSDIVSLPFGITITIKNEKGA